MRRYALTTGGSGASLFAFFLVGIAGAAALIEPVRTPDATMRSACSLTWLRVAAGWRRCRAPGRGRSAGAAA